jgi:predicted metal-dependent hydrolase
MISSEEVDRLFEQAILHFNNGNYFECHDCLELIWLQISSRERHFFQGMLHIAVGLYHFENKNYRGARNQLYKAVRRLVHFQPSFNGVDVDRVLMAAEPYRHAALICISGRIPEDFHPEKPVWHRKKME